MLPVGPALDVVGRTAAGLTTLSLGRESRIVPAHRPKPIGWAAVRKARWYAAAAGLGALAFGLATARGRGRELDRRLYRALNGTGSRGTELLFKSVTELGSIAASIGASMMLARAGRRREGLDALGAAGSTWLLGQGLKRMVGRPRPFHALPEFRLLIGEPSGTSWPSSHPAVLLAWVTVASRDLDASPPTRFGLALLAGLVGVSRVYLGVHYPADVAGGVLVGRGVADLWTAAISPKVLGRPPGMVLPSTVIG